MRIASVVLSAMSIPVGVVGAADGDTVLTNWKVDVVIEFRQARPMDSTVELRNPSREKGMEQVDTFVEKLEADISKKIPTVFYTNPPWAGTLMLKAVMRQKVSAKVPSVENVYRATEVAHSKLEGKHFPEASAPASHEQTAKGISLKAKDYEFAGVNITLTDFEGKEVMSLWYSADSRGKMKTKTCAKDLIRAMKLVAARSDLPRGNWKRPPKPEIE